LARPKNPPPFPTKQQVIEFVRDNPGRASRREIARAFHIKGESRPELTRLIQELRKEGLMDSGRGGRSAASRPASGRAAALPEMLVLEVAEIDEDGEVLAKPLVWDRKDQPPKIYLAPAARPGLPAFGVGDRVLARVARDGAHSFIATPIRAIEHAPERIVGIFEKGQDGGGRIRSADRRNRDEYRVMHGDTADARAGEMVEAELLPAHRYGQRQARVIDRLGLLGEPRSVSLIAIRQHGIPTEFSSQALAEAEAAGPVELGARADFRDLPLVTIDGADARDFDDAVFAEPDADKENPGGWHLIVAIADVAHYVLPGSGLDRDAYERGNSVYFPDRVVPMLPEALSNNLCSLRPAEDRACMAVHMWIDAEGRKLSHRFQRGLMRSAARLTYEQAQAAADGRTDETTAPLTDKVIAPLYGAYRSLSKARSERGTLDLDLPERQVKLDAAGAVIAIVPRTRLDSHRLIEEFMILANVCAAETLEQARLPAMYRIHDEPSPEKLESLRIFLGTLGLKLAKGQVIFPKHFMQLLTQVRGTQFEAMVNQVVLRSQAQAAYSPDNIGHFGLALRRYAHFTSPIRRYADLLVHRALIRALKAGEGALPEKLAIDFIEMGAHISATERRAAQAEREVVERYAAQYLAQHVGSAFRGRINGVTRFGLFVTLDETGADGLVPIRSLPQDYYHHDETRHCLVGRRHGRTYRLGEPVTIELAEADIVTGGMLFLLVEEEAQGSDGEQPHRAGGRPASAPAGERKARRGSYGPKRGNRRRRA
jgi:ribonuclease R